MNKKVVRIVLPISLLAIGLLLAFLFLCIWRVYFENGILYYSWRPEYNPSRPVVNPIAASRRDFHIKNGILYAYTGSDENVIIPDDVTHIGQSAFIMNLTARTVYIPYGVNTIGRYAFAHVSYLESINIPNSVTIIREGAFDSCKSLEAIYIPDSVVSIGYGAFFGCESLISVRLSENLTYIDAGTFVGCSALEHIEIPGRVTAIYLGAFAMNPSLVSIRIPESVTRIDSNVFFHTENVTISGERGSYAEEFANQMNIPFVAED